MTEGAVNDVMRQSLRQLTTNPIYGPRYGVDYKLLYMETNYIRNHAANQYRPIFGVTDPLVQK